MRRLATLISAALVTVGVTVGVPSLASASFPGDGGTSYQIQRSTSTITGVHDVYVTLHRSGEADDVGDVFIEVLPEVNHLGQHQKKLFITNTDPTANIHLQVQGSGGNVVDYHATTAGAQFKRSVYYTISRFRLTLGSYATPWFGQP